jgi:hypothetical protein
VPTPPRDQLAQVIVGDFGDQLGLAEVVDHAGEVAFRIVGTGVMLPDLNPIAVGNMIELQRDRRILRLGCVLLSALALGAFYFLGFAS